jgi:hypothetical protein
VGILTEREKMSKGDRNWLKSPTTECLDCGGL